MRINLKQKHFFLNHKNPDSVVVFLAQQLLSGSSQWQYRVDVQHETYMPQGSHIGIVLKLPRYCSSLSLLFGAQNRLFHQISALNVRIYRLICMIIIFLRKYIKNLCAQWKCLRKRWFCTRPCFSDESSMMHLQWQFLQLSFKWNIRNERNKLNEKYIVVQIFGMAWHYLKFSSLWI